MSGRYRRAILAGLTINWKITEGGAEEKFRNLLPRSNDYRRRSYKPRSLTKPQKASNPSLTGGAGSDRDSLNCTDGFDHLRGFLSSPTTKAWAHGMLSDESIKHASLTQYRMKITTYTYQVSYGTRNSLQT